MPDPVEASTSSAWGPLRRHDVLVSGLASGLLGGLVMALFLTLCASIHQMEPLYPWAVVGATLAGPGALEGGASTVAYGAVVHLATSAAYGLLFAAMFPRALSVGCATVVGVGYALFVLGFMTSCVTPSVNPAFRGEMQPIGGSWVIAHALFGAVLGLAPPLRRRLASKAADQGAEIARSGSARPPAVPEQRAAKRTT